MNNEKLEDFIKAGLEKWEAIKKDLSQGQEMSVYLKQSYPVVVFDHHQLELDFVKNMCTGSDLSKKEKPKPEEIKKACLKVPRI